jgi:hypothetical protein
MAAPRKHPPKDAIKTIEKLAAEGYSIIGIARNLGVSRECFKRWIEEDKALNEAFELGRETERQALHAMVVESARANKPANVNAFFLLKARHGYVESDNRSKAIVEVAANNVLVVVSHGTDEQWAAKLAAQQRALMLPDSIPHQPAEVTQATQVDPVASFGPPSYLPPICAPQAAPVHPVTAPAPIFAPGWRGNA